MSDNTTFQGFGKGFQEKLAQLIMDDSQFANQIGEVLNTGFFELKYLQTFSKMIYDYKDKYKKYPSSSTIQSILKSGLDDENEAIETQVKEFYVRAAKGLINSVDEEFVKEKSLDFCRKQKLKEAFIQSQALMNKCSFDQISKVINDALKAGANNDSGYRFIEQFEERYSLTARRTVTTGWDPIDEITRGGLAQGELGVCIAPTGAGKSMCLTHLGAQALISGKNVVHYTLELGDKTIGLRYDSAISGIDLNSLYHLKDDVFDSVKDVKGQLIIKEYPTKSATTETLKNHLERLQQTGFTPQMIIVDYGDLLKPISSFKEKRESLETIYEDLRNLAKEFDCPVWTASQTNRSGLNAEVITMESISEAFSKCFVADFIFSVSRTIADKQNNTGRIFVAKNRFGPDGIVFPIFMDTSNVSIKVLPATNESIGEIEDKAKESASKAQEKYLKQKYKEMRNKGAKKQNGASK